MFLFFKLWRGIKIVHYYIINSTISHLVPWIINVTIDQNILISHFFLCASFGKHHLFKFAQFYFIVYRSQMLCTLSVWLWRLLPNIQSCPLHSTQDSSSNMFAITDSVKKKIHSAHLCTCLFIKYTIILILHWYDHHLKFTKIFLTS